MFFVPLASSTEERWWVRCVHRLRLPRTRGCGGPVDGARSWLSIFSERSSSSTAVFWRMARYYVGGRQVENDNKLIKKRLVLERDQETTRESHRENVVVHVVRSSSGLGPGGRLVLRRLLLVKVGRHHYLDQCNRGRASSMHPVTAFCSMDVWEFLLYQRKRGGFADVRSSLRGIANGLVGVRNGGGGGRVLLLQGGTTAVEVTGFGFPTCFLCLSSGYVLWRRVPAPRGTLLL